MLTAIALGGTGKKKKEKGKNRSQTASKCFILEKQSSLYNTAKRLAR